MSTLAERMKPAPQPPAGDPAAPAKKALLVRVERESIRRLKLLAADQERSMAALAAEALDDLFLKYTRS